MASQSPFGVTPPHCRQSRLVTSMNSWESRERCQRWTNTIRRFLELGMVSGPEITTYRTASGGVRARPQPTRSTRSSMFVCCSCAAACTTARRLVQFTTPTLPRSGLVAAGAEPNTSSRDREHNNWRYLISACLSIQPCWTLCRPAPGSRHNSVNDRLARHQSGSTGAGLRLCWCACRR
jgi:hypothetical protein